MGSVYLRQQRDGDKHTRHEADNIDHEVEIEVGGAGTHIHGLLS